MIRAFSRDTQVVATTQSPELLDAKWIESENLRLVTRIGQTLGLRQGTQEFEAFHDLAAKGRDEVPADVTRIVRENDLIPAMLRTVAYENVTEKQLRGIIEDLKSGRYKRAQPKR
jgi:hypothetical protein